MNSAQQPYDVAVVGAGVVGSAIARELTGFDLQVALIESRNDVGDATSKANTAILHTGFDADPGTLESQLVRRGAELLRKYAGDTGIPVESTGAVLVAWSEEEQDTLPSLKAKAERNGYAHCELLSADEVYALEPELATGVRGGMTVPDESIICTWTTSLALATEAKLRGADLRLGHHVTDVSVGNELTTVHTSQGTIQTRWLVNAAGLGSDEIDRLLGHDRVTITPRRGELLVFDKLAAPLVHRVILPVPTSRGKGVLISPTIYGNIMLGPTAEDLTDKSATETSETGLEYLQAKGKDLLPQLVKEEVTASYAGLRAASDHGDYLIDTTSRQRYVCVSGIRSTGLTASLAIGEYVTHLLEHAGLEMSALDHLPNPPRMPNLGEAFTRPYQDQQRIMADPEYGRIVCFCERVTRGEIRDAYSTPIPPADLNGLRRRTRALNGRCQGFFCGAEIASYVQSLAPSGLNTDKGTNANTTEARHDPS